MVGLAGLPRLRLGQADSAARCFSVPLQRPGFSNPACRRVLIPPALNEGWMAARGNNGRGVGNAPTGVVSLDFMGIGSWLVRLSDAWRCPAIPSDFWNPHGIAAFCRGWQEPDKPETASRKYGSRITWSGLRPSVTPLPDRRVGSRSDCSWRNFSRVQPRLHLMTLLSQSAFGRNRCSLPVRRINASKRSAATLGTSNPSVTSLSIIQSVP